MGIDRRQVEHIAELAKLELTPEEIEIFASQLSVILEHFRSLQEVDTGGIPPTAQVIPLRNVLRQDEVVPSLPTEDVLSNAPHKEKGYIKTPPLRE
ncbi:MAG: Asp-tRNA(Asn)/Glu-tRNA(Gln) amidotransferase subunit GatC [Chloroflexi bacterium]|nr:Asp-tRNA(Asn)/Glu-tRNA(Gln) amidotransferase subunit GatC [Chloroflexota bacterium]